MKEKEELLLECTEGTYEDNHTSLECLREIKATSKDLSQHLSGYEFCVEFWVLVWTSSC